MTTATRPTPIALGATGPHHRPPLSGDLATDARETVSAATASLFRKLRTDQGGHHFCSELEGDSILSSEYLLMKWILGQEGDRPIGDPDRFARICNHIRLVQRSDGLWGMYPDSPPDVSASVKAYFVLKLFGEDPSAPHMARAREAILAIGGADRLNTFSNFYLACLGQVTWGACPAIPPEIVLFPRWFPFHLDKVAAWTRTMILPLAICSALRPVRTIPAELCIDELFVDPERSKHYLNQPWDRDEPIGWTNIFLFCDRVLKKLQRNGAVPMRELALVEAERWILDRIRPETTEGLGAIFPPMVYLQIAFKALGYQRSDPTIIEAERQLDAFIVEESNEDPRLDHVRLQPCFSPVWDTGISLYALTEAGLTVHDDERVGKICDWLVERQVKRNGDWIRNVRPDERSIRLGREVSAWAFEYRNEWYPDVDDTAMICKALWRAGDRPGSTRNRETALKARRWILAMQNDDGGWAAFDRTKDRGWMEAVPFADHNAMQDPSCSDITGRTIESLITCGLNRDHPSIRNAVRYLLDTQHSNGCWIGRWGVNYIYGTWQALGGMTYALSPERARESEPVKRAIEWVRSVQNTDGGFGETANSYIDPALMGQGPSTASQTAWGLMCLLYAESPHDPAIERAVRWLCDHNLASDKPPFTPAETANPQTPDALTAELSGTDFVKDFAGGWNEHLFTGTGFPQVFYLRYNLYRHYFPMMAVARYVNAIDGVLV